MAPAAAAAAAPSPAAAAPSPTLKAALALHRKHAPVVFLDPSGTLNLAGRVSRPALAAAQGAAKRTLALLDKPVDAEAAFAAAFLSPARSAVATADYSWRVQLPPTGGAAADAAAGSSAAPLGDVPLWQQQERQVESLVTRALGSRATWVRALPRRLGPQLPGSSSSCGGGGVPAGCAAEALAKGLLVPAADEDAVLVVAR